MELDRIDAKLLAELQRDGRKPVVELAEAVGLSPTPCARRLRLLEESGVIRGYTAVLDPRRLGLEVQAFVQIKLERHSDENIEQFRQALGAIDEVVSCHATTGEFDFALHVIAHDLDAMSELILRRLLKLQAVRDVHSSIVLETVKRPGLLPLGHL